MAKLLSIKFEGFYTRVFLLKLRGHHLTVSLPRLKCVFSSYNYASLQHRIKLGKGLMPEKSILESQHPSILLSLGYATAKWVSWFPAKKLSSWVLTFGGCRAGKYIHIFSLVWLSGILYSTLMLEHQNHTVQIKSSDLLDSSLIFSVILENTWNA